MNKMTMYGLLPVWAQQLACSYEGCRIMRQRYNAQFWAELTAYRERAYNPRKELLGFLKAVRSVPVYRDVLTPSFFAEASEGNVQQMVTTHFPIIDKGFVKKNLERIVNHDCRESMFIARTSGTTGGGLVFPETQRAEKRQWAVWWRYRLGLGIEFGTWMGWFGGKLIIMPDSHRVPYWRINRPGRQVMFSSFHLTRQTVKYYCGEIREKQLPWLHGYPSHIAKLAALMVDSGQKPIECVRFVTTGAENLIGNQVKLIQQAFPNAIVRNHYGQAEGMANLSQDKNGEWQMDDDFAFMEFIPIDKEDPARCRIVGTNFCNPAFPLIRYDSGDVAVVEKDETGRIRVVTIEGRTANVIRGPAGEEINEARLSIVLHDFNNIVEAQFHQKSPTNVDLWIVKNSAYCESDEKLLKQNIATNFGNNIQVQLKYVDSIARTKSGKLKLVVVEEGMQGGER